jgi:hypothetical protein
MTPVEKLGCNGVRMPSGCLEWAGGRDPDGYGIVRIDGVSRRVPRLAWELENGPIPPGMLIRHTCDNPPCFEISHLMTGTHRDNVADMYERQRAADRRGERCPTSKLTWPQVREIRQLIAAGASQDTVSSRFGVSRRNVRKIIRHETWKETT